MEEVLSPKTERSEPMNATARILATHPNPDVRDTGPCAGPQLDFAAQHPAHRKPRI